MNETQQNVMKLNHLLHVMKEEQKMRILQVANTLSNAETIMNDITCLLHYIEHLPDSDSSVNFEKLYYYLKVSVSDWKSSGKTSTIKKPKFFKRESKSRYTEKTTSISDKLSNGIDKLVSGKLNFNAMEYQRVRGILSVEQPEHRSKLGYEIEGLKREISKVKSDVSNLSVAVNTLLKNDKEKCSEDTYCKIDIRHMKENIAVLTGTINKLVKVLQTANDNQLPQLVPGNSSKGNIDQRNIGECLHTLDLDSIVKCPTEVTNNMNINQDCKANEVNFVTKLENNVSCNIATRPVDDHNAQSVNEIKDLNNFQRELKVDQVINDLGLTHNDSSEVASWLACQLELEKGVAAQIPNNGTELKDNLMHLELT